MFGEYRLICFIFQDLTGFSHSVWVGVTTAKALYGPNRFLRVSSEIGSVSVTMTRSVV